VDAGRFEKPAPDARAAPPETHESLIGRKAVEEVPLTGLSLSFGRLLLRTDRRLYCLETSPQPKPSPR